jgi:hypothetical protein
MDTIEKYDNILKQFNSHKDIIYSDVWDELAFGIKKGIQLIDVDKINIIYDVDYEEAKRDDKYFNNVKFENLPPVDVSYYKGKLNLEDGHHRYYYAKKNYIKKIKADVTIKDSPYVKLGISIDDLIKRFDKLKNKKEDSMNEKLINTATFWLNENEEIDEGKSNTIDLLTTKFIKFLAEIKNDEDFISLSNEEKNQLFDIFENTIKRDYHKKK